METVGRYFNVVQLCRGAAGKPRVAGDGKTDVHAARHVNDDMAALVTRRDGGVSRGAHAISPESTLDARGPA